MLAKLIAWAPDRRTAAARLAAALAGAEIDGLVTNRDFLARLLRSEPFAAGETDTGLLDRELGLAEPLVDPAIGPRLSWPPRRWRRWRNAGTRPGCSGFVPPGFRNNFSEPQRVSFATAAGDEVEVSYALRRGGAEIAVAGTPLEGATSTGSTADEVDLERRRGPPPLPSPPLAATPTTSTAPTASSTCESCRATRAARARSPRERWSRRCPAR